MGSPLKSSTLTALQVSVYKAAVGVLYSVTADGSQAHCSKTPSHSFSEVSLHDEAPDIGRGGRAGMVRHPRNQGSCSGEGGATQADRSEMTERHQAHPWPWRKAPGTKGVLTVGPPAGLEERAHMSRRHPSCLWSPGPLAEACSKEEVSCFGFGSRD